MHITFSPSRDDHCPVFIRQGDVLIIDGEAFDFGPLPDGALLPAEAVDSDWVCGDVTREAGVLHLTLKLGHGADAPREVRFPAPVGDVADGPIPLPGTPVAQQKAEQT